MSLLRSLSDGLRSLFRKERVEGELDEELRDFLEMAAEEKMKQGMSRKDALRAVRLERGSLEVTKEVVRSAGWESLVATFWQDLRFGLSHAPQESRLHRRCRSDPGAGHRRNHRDLLSRRRRPAAPTSLPGCRPAGFVRRSSGRPARHVRQGSRNRNVYKCDAGIFLSGWLYRRLV